MMKIDGREPDSLKYHDWEMETEVVENMKVGDFVIDDAICIKHEEIDEFIEAILDSVEYDISNIVDRKDVCIERKEINDLVQSLNNRVWEQVMNMEENYNRNFLIVHGTVSDLSSRNMEPRKISAIYGSLVRLGLTYNVNVFWFRAESQLIKAINKIHSKGGTKSKREKPHIEKRNFRDDRVNVICGIYGVGYETAKNLLDELDSVAGIATASKSELAKAHGVGEKTANKIYDIMHQGEQDNLL